jgi:hypothetical protein
MRMAQAGGKLLPCRVSVDGPGIISVTGITPKRAHMPHVACRGQVSGKV